MTDFDQEMMRRAVSLAQEARLDAPPNPWVGCVIVKEGKIVGEGFTQPPGKAHAEIMALQQAGTQAIDSEVYVTLEPCAHYGRTPPCTKALIAAGVSRVIVGIEDPDSNVKGKGIAQLKEAGIVVELGIQEDSIQTLLTPYLHHRKTGLPYCIAKAGMSLDGRIAAADGSSKWISSPEARAHAHQLRAESQAIMVGAGTALADQPQLTVRDVVKRPLRPPLRVVWDPNGKTTQASPLFDTSIAPTLMLTTSSCSPEAMQIWKNMEVIFSSAGLRYQLFCSLVDYFSGL